MQWRVVLVLLVTVLCLVALGGFIFFMIEAGNETKLREESQQRTKVFLRDYPCVSESEYWYLAERVIREYQTGVLALRNKTTSTNWDIMSSAYFATTVLTTIGFGHISPLTQAGRIFVVFYALLGIPITLMFLLGLGGRLARLRTSTRAGAILQAALTIIIGVCIFMLLAAIMFWKVEGWSYVDSLYFVFVTLTTLGFGDLHPGQSQAAAALGWYRLVVAGWILVSMIWLSTALVMCSDALKGGYKGKNKKEILEVATNNTTEPVMMVRPDNMMAEQYELEQFEMAEARSRRMSVAAAAAASDIRRKSIAQITMQDEEALRSAVQDAVVAQAYKDMAAQVVKDMATTTPAVTNPALATALTSAAFMSPDVPVPSPEVAAAAVLGALPVPAPRAVAMALEEAAVTRAVEDAVAAAVVDAALVANTNVIVP